MGGCGEGDCLLLWSCNVLPCLGACLKVPRKAFTLLVALMSIHKRLGDMGEPMGTLEMRKSQRWLQSSFLVQNKSSSGYFPHGQESGLPAAQMDGSGSWKAGTQQEKRNRLGGGCLGCSMPEQVPPHAWRSLSWGYPGGSVPRPPSVAVPAAEAGRHRGGLWGQGYLMPTFLPVSRATSK